MKSIFIYGQNSILTNYVKAFSSTKTKTICSQDLTLADKCSTLVLAGGGDLSPSLYRENNYHCQNIDYKRDLDELYLIDKFCQQKKPIVGICRGIQILNVYFGGSLIQHIDGHCQIDGIDTTHQIVCRKQGILHNYYGNNAQVNSAHHQAINTCGKWLIPDSVSSDGIIESVYHFHLPIYGFQFHPERLPDNKRLINFILHKLT